MKLSRRKSFSPIGVDVDGRSIAAVQLSLTGEGFQIEAATVPRFCTISPVDKPVP